MSKKEKTENDAVVFLGDIQSSFKGMKLGMLINALVCVTVSLGANFIANKRADAAAKNIYVVDKGSVLMANRNDNGEQRDLEVIDHVSRFHELFFNLAPNITLINQNIERALELADKSAYNYFSDLKESKYYSRLIDINATQQISIDSIDVNIFKYPYEVETKASLYVMRESNISLYTITSTCQVMETERTPQNPHGLMITNFYANKPEFKRTQRKL